MSQDKSKNSFPTVRGLSQLDANGVLKNSHEIQLEALRIINCDTLVEGYFTRADVQYNVQNSAISADFYYDKTFHEERIQLINDISGSLNSTYFLVDGPALGNKYYIWNDVDSLGIDPLISGRTGIRVPLQSNDESDFIAIAIKTACLNNVQFASEFDVKNFDNYVNFTTKSLGECEFEEVNTGFNFVVISQGISEFIKHIDLPYENGVRYVYNEFNKTFDLFSDSGSTPITEYQENSPSEVTSSGPFVLGKRLDNNLSPVSNDGDYHGIIFDNLGNLKTKDSLALSKLDEIRIAIQDNGSLISGTQDGTPTGTPYVFLNNLRKQILDTEDRQQQITYADFGTKNERITQISYTSALFPGISAVKSISYTLVGSFYRKDSINWTLT